MIAASQNPPPTFAELSEELLRLRQFGQRLAQRLAKATALMQDSGLPPSVDFFDELQAYRKRLHLLAGYLAEDAGHRALDGTSDADATTPNHEISWDRLQARLEFRQRLQIAESVQVRLSQLTHVDIPDFAPLALCVRESARLCELADGSGAEDQGGEIRQLIQQRHPLNALLRLAENGDQLSDQEWTDCCDNVAATYGRQLATALTRGKIRAAGSDVATTDRVGLPPSNSANRSAETAHDSVVASATVPVSNVTVFDLPQSVPSSATQLQSAATAAATLLSHNEASIFLSPSVKPSAPTLELHSVPYVSTNAPQSETSAAVSRTASSVDGVQDRPRQTTETSAARAVQVSNQIIRLMAEDRLPLALQLIRCLEMRPETSLWMPPSWLFRALVLGRNLSYSKGDIARQLDDELRNFRPDMLNECHAERQMTLGLLLRAAALPAALLAGSTAATVILRAFKIAPGFSQLYNYCSRIAFYGDRLGGGLVEMFRPSGTIAGASELEELATTAKDWLQAAVRKCTRYSRSSPLFLHAHWTLTSGTAIRHADTTQQWCRWQETLLLAQRLLKPVCQGLDGERNWVRQEIARLTAQMRVELDEATQRNGFSPQMGERGPAAPVEETHATLLEAIAIANRWLRICNQAGPGGAAPIPLEVLELRDEILQRSDAVIGELIQQRRGTAAPLVNAAIACCQATVRQIQMLFESKLSLPLVEPDPVRVLNADLLRIPGLELNDQWLPDAEPAIFERELLTGLEHGELNWLQSFEFHAQAGHHDATGRLLELDVWDNDHERETLRALRDAQIADSRAILSTELNELAGEISQMIDTAGQSDLHRAAYVHRLDSLRRELPRTLNFSAFRRRLNQLQSAVQRRAMHQSPMTGSSASTVFRDIPNHRTTDEAFATNCDPRSLSDNSRNHASIFHSTDIFSGE